VKDAEEGGLLDEGGVLGSDGGVAATAGMAVTWDGRDHPFVPSHGFLVDLVADFASDRVGSDFTYNLFQANIRVFFPGLTGGHTVGLQGVVEARTGEPPFQLLGSLGGESLLRGYHGRRFVDRNKLAAQAEYRMPVWGRLGGVLFAGFGDVARDLEDLEAGKMKHTLGWGLRYGWKPGEGINIRFDLGYGAGGSGAYVGLTESF
jgi:outer membrane protein assembly factor BamA